MHAFFVEGRDPRHRPTADDLRAASLNLVHSLQQCPHCAHAFFLDLANIVEKDKSPACTECGRPAKIGDKVVETGSVLGMRTYGLRKAVRNAAE